MMRSLFFFLISLGSSLPAAAQTESSFSVTAAEYYVDSDPGEGNGIPFSAQDGLFGGLTEQVTSVLSTEGLEPGLHLLSIRFKTEDGNWTPAIRQVFSVNPAPSALPANRTETLTSAEFFAGNDPGEGNGTPLTLSGGPVSAATGSLPTSALSGNYRLSVRVHSALNGWSQPVSLVFSVSPALTAASVNRPAGVVAAEVYTGDDPGEGNGNSLSPASQSQGSFSAGFSGDLQLLNLQTGRNTVSVRFKNTAGEWSDPVPVPVIRYEPAGDILVAWEKESARDSLLSALGKAGFLADNWYLPAGIPSFSAWKTVLWDEQDWVKKEERDSLMAFLSGPGEPTLLISGENIAGFHELGRSQQDTTFLYQYLHAKLRFDSGGSGKKPVFGRLIHAGVTDSVSVTDQDVIRPVNGGQSVAAWQSVSQPDSALAVAWDGIYNTAYSTFYWNQMTRGLEGFLARTLVWAQGSGGSLPVELTEFKGTVLGGKVTLSWSTRSETANAGWEIWVSAGSGSWQKTGFIPGAGTTLEPKTYSFSFRRPVPSRQVQVQLRQFDLDGTVTLSRILELEEELPGEFAISHAYPNPFNPETGLDLELPVKSDLRADIYSITGQLIRTEKLSGLDPGRFRLTWNGNLANGEPAASGVYFWRISVHSDLSGKTLTRIRKMTLLK